MTVSNERQRSDSVPPAEAAGRLAAVLAAASVAARAAVDPDLWGHLRFGMDLATTGRLSALDPYSFTQDRPWINHEWLSELLFALAYRAAGVPGLLALKVAILAVAFALLAAVARRADAQYRWWLLAIAVFGLGPIAATFRPQLWTILGLAILVYCLSARKHSAWLPVLFAVWANMHGGWIVGAGVAGLWLVGRVIDTRSIRAHVPVGIALFTAVLATLLNPYGWRLWEFLVTTVGPSRDISEWRPLWERFEVEYILLWPLMVGVVLTTMIARWRYTTWATILPTMWLAVAGLLVSRLAPLFGEVALLFTALAWQRSQLEAAETAQAGSAGPRARGMRLVVDAIAVIVVIGPSLVGSARCLEIGGDSAPDLVAGGAFESASVRGRVVIPFTWGEYAIWHWGPRLLVSMDGRRETIYSQATLDLLGDVVAGRPLGLEYLGRVRPEYVWLPHAGGGPTGAWLVGNGYRIDVRTTDSYIATRDDLPVLAPGSPMTACLR